MEIAGAAEPLGYDHLWVYDHVETVPRREPTHCFEAFTMLAALSQRSPDIELGQLVTCVGYRNVGLFAKEAACVDVLSGGRLILGIGAGWYEREYQAYGWEYPSDRDRLQILEETSRSSRGCGPRRPSRTHGKHLTFDGAYCDPKPIQPPPADLGRRRRREGHAAHRGEARRHDRTGRSASRPSSASRACSSSTATRSAATSIDRAHPRPRLPSCSTPRPTSPPGSTRPAAATSGAEAPHDEYVRDNLVGTVEQVAEKVQAFVDAGCREFVLWFRDAPADDSMTAWIEQVARALGLSEPGR